MKIIIDDNIRHGKPILEGTRITVDEVLGFLAGGMTYEEIEKEYGIDKETILATIKYVALIIKNEETYSLSKNEISS